MRAPVWMVTSLCAGGVAAANPGAGSGSGGKPAAPKPADPEVIDIAAYRAQLVVLSDDDGAVYVVKPRATTDDKGPVFVGDGKVFYDQHMTGMSFDGSHATWSYNLWAPRVPGYDDATVSFDKDKKYWLSCGTEKMVELRPVGKKETDRVLAGGEFRPRLWKRTPHLLARDDDGTYYYVDRDLDERDRNRASIHEKRYQRGHRVFAGKKGAMKELPMTNVVADSAGEIYQTKRGDLRIVTSTDKTASWVRGKKKTPLTLLEPGDNRYLIFRELGVYGFMGTVCEDL